ncbi:hypothetical protein CDL15_Pgr000356 [Punica granatum]|uniref:S1-like domain-containing protein n=3 Tax=Punica granatum TaxID=22663 RepID=A0A218XTI8_PUNGR|nr:hypothetical protein CDL15_Pgr000356 [Punica granatum]
MKAGRKNLQRATKEQDVTLQDGESIVQVVSLRGSNLVEVTDAKGQNSLALFPAKFQKTMWIKRGNFIIVDDSAKEKALESGSKVACIVSRVLSYDQVRVLQKSPQWPEVFKSPTSDEPNNNLKAQTSEAEEEKENDSDCSEDDGLPPLEANTNRIRPFELHTDTESDSDSDTDP